MKEALSGYGPQELKSRVLDYIGGEEDVFSRIIAQLYTRLASPLSYSDKEEAEELKEIIGKLRRAEELVSDSYSEESELEDSLDSLISQEISKLFDTINSTKDYSLMRYLFELINYYLSCSNSGDQSSPREGGVTAWYGGRYLYKINQEKIRELFGYNEKGEVQRKTINATRHVRKENKVFYKAKIPGSEDNIKAGEENSSVIFCKTFSDSLGLNYQFSASTGILIINNLNVGVKQTKTDRIAQTGLEIKGVLLSELLYTIDILKLFDSDQERKKLISEIIDLTKKYDEKQYTESNEIPPDVLNEAVKRFTKIVKAEFSETSEKLLPHNLKYIIVDVIGGTSLKNLNFLLEIIEKFPSLLKTKFFDEYNLHALQELERLPQSLSNVIKLFENEGKLNIINKILTIEDDVDFDHLSYLLLIMIITRPSDAKGDNFIATRTESGFQFIGIDNDGTDAPRALRIKSTPIIGVRSILFYKKRFMEKTIPHEIKNKFSNMNPKDFFYSWFLKLHDQNIEYLKALNQGTIGRSADIPIKLNFEDIVKRYLCLIKIINAIKIEKPNFYDLLGQSDEFLLKYYKHITEKAPNSFYAGKKIFSDRAIPEKFLPEISRIKWPNEDELESKPKQSIEEIILLFNIFCKFNDAGVEKEFIDRAILAGHSTCNFDVLTIGLLKKTGERKDLSHPALGARLYKQLEEFHRQSDGEKLSSSDSCQKISSTVFLKTGLFEIGNDEELEAPHHDIAKAKYCFALAYKHPNSSPLDKAKALLYLANMYYMKGEFFSKEGQAEKFKVKFDDTYKEDPLYSLELLIAAYGIIQTYGLNDQELTEKIINKIILLLVVNSSDLTSNHLVSCLQAYDPIFTYAIKLPNEIDEGLEPKNHYNLFISVVKILEVLYDHLNWVTEHAKEIEFKFITHLSTRYYNLCLFSTDVLQQYIGTQNFSNFSELAKPLKKLKLLCNAKLYNTLTLKTIFKNKETASLFVKFDNNIKEINELINIRKNQLKTICERLGVYEDNLANSLRIFKIDDNVYISLAISNPDYAHTKYKFKNINAKIIASRENKDSGLTIIIQLPVMEYENLCNQEPLSNEITYHVQEKKESYTFETSNHALSVHDVIFTDLPKMKVTINEINGEGSEKVIAIQPDKNEHIQEEYATNLEDEARPSSNDLFNSERLCLILTSKGNKDDAKDKPLGGSQSKGKNKYYSKLTELMPQEKQTLPQKTMPSSLEPIPFVLALILIPFTLGFSMLAYLFESYFFSENASKHKQPETFEVNSLDHLSIPQTPVPKKPENVL